MFRFLPRPGAGLCVFLFAFAALFGPSAQALPPNPLGLIPDDGFGSATGFAAIPKFASADVDSVTTPAALVALPHSGGYLAASTQKVSGNTRMVLTRYDAAGQLATGWGVGGSQMPGLGIPFATPRLVVGEEAGQDIFYLAYSIYSAPNFYVAVAKFQADGSFDPNFGFGGYAVTNLPITSPAGIGGLSAAAFATVNGTPTLVLLVPIGNMKFTFVRAAGSGSGALSDDGPGAIVSTSPDPIYLLQMRARGGNRVAVAGAKSPTGWYGEYDAATHAFASTMLRFRCSNGFEGSSAIEAIAFPAGFNGDALVEGKVSSCLDGPYAVLARVANIATAPSLVWNTLTDTNTDPCASNYSACTHSLLAYSDARPDVAVTISPDGIQVPVRLRDGAKLGESYVSSVDPGVDLMASNQRGVVFDGTRLLGLAQQSGAAGLGAVRIDRLFGDGFE